MEDDVCSDDEEGYLTERAARFEQEPLQDSVFVKRGDVDLKRPKDRDCMSHVFILQGPFRRMLECQ